MYITFLDIDVGTRKKVLNRVGAKLIGKFGSVPDAPNEFEREFNELCLDTDIVTILKNEYDSTGYTISYTVDQLYEEYHRMMR